jgi:hypothetical protein
MLEHLARAQHKGAGNHFVPHQVREGRAQLFLCALIEGQAEQVAVDMLELEIARQPTFCR